MTTKLIVFDSHPVQYRVPVWQCLEKKYPQMLHVVYASDCSMKGFKDDGFGKTFAWDEPMLEGYSYTILGNENGIPLAGWNSLSGKGIWEVLSKQKPQAVLLTGLNYRYDLTVLVYSKLKGISVWLRCETQDFSVERSKVKSVLRKIIYGVLYNFIDKFFYIGELNKKHYLAHGVSQNTLFPAKYCTVNRYQGMSENTKVANRNRLRSDQEINEDKCVIGFSGKFIPKKNPQILYEMIEFLPIDIRNKLVLYFVGSGELEEVLKKKAKEIELQYGIKSVFTGFINQSEIGLHYLVMDIFVLPSKRMGETWGLVVNEAMQAGCAIVISDAVGCGEDFKKLERVGIFTENNGKNLAERIKESTKFERNFEWANNVLKDYSIESVADSLIKQMS
jgi:glycosyltransferase involved in cell wall biosynthesis